MILLDFFPSKYIMLLYKEVLLNKKIDDLSKHFKKNIKESLDGLNEQAKGILDEIIILGKSSISLTKMITGKEIPNREKEIVKNHVTELGNACISFASTFLPGAKKLLPILEKYINEKPTPKVLQKVVDNEMKTNWINTIKLSLNNPSLYEKISNKIKEQD